MAPWAFAAAAIIAAILIGAMALCRQLEALRAELSIGAMAWCRQLEALRAELSPHRETSLPHQPSWEDRQRAECERLAPEIAAIAGQIVAAHRSSREYALFRQQFTCAVASVDQRRERWRHAAADAVARIPLKAEAQSLLAEHEEIEREDRVNSIWERENDLFCGRGALEEFIKIASRLRHEAQDYLLYRSGICTRSPWEEQTHAAEEMRRSTSQTIEGRLLGALEKAAGNQAQGAADSAS